MLTVQLPGGLLVDGIRYQIATFRPITGVVELAIEEAKDANESYPAFVTRVLSIAVESIGSVPFSAEVARALSVADRQVLLLRLSVLLGRDMHWLQPTCAGCGNRFDLSIKWSELPVVDAPADYPVFEGKLGDQPIRLRVLTGAVEERLAGIEDDTAALRVLVEYVVDWGAKGSPQQLSKKALDEIERQLEDGSPAVADELASQCPYCQKEVRLELDFSAGLFEGDSILEEIHQMATHYHWSEAAIAALPRRRRRSYLEMINGTTSEYE